MTPPLSTQGADWPTYHRDLARSGYDAAPVSSQHPSIRWSAPLDQEAYAEPLVVGTSVLVATEGDTVSALDSTTGALRWSTHLGEPMAGSSLPCGDIDPSGITGTPVVDAQTSTVWVVDFVRPGRHELVGLNFTTGRIRSRRAADPPGASPLVEQQRGALTISSGRIYVPYGGLFGDCGDYRGYVLGFDERGGTSPLVYRVPTSRGGGIWAPSGAAVGSDGSLFVATGNSASTGTFDGGNAVIRLSPQLLAEDRFAPSNFAALDTTDSDLGSTGPVLVPGGLLFQIGKAGVGYLLDAGALGGIGAPATSVHVCEGAFGSVAVTAAAGGAGPIAVVPCTDGLVALRVSSAHRVEELWRRSDVVGGPPIVAGSQVWVQDPRAGDLLALDIATGATVARVAVGAATRFSTPAAGSDRIYAVGGRRLSAIGSA